MAIRPFSFPADFQILEQLTQDAYQYPQEMGWRTRDFEEESGNFSDMLHAASRFWPLIALGQLISPATRNVLRGFVWEEDGKPVGLIATGAGANCTWWIANLAVLPDYRRRGIARHLVQAAIDAARASGAQAITLDVIADNLPAVRLYQSMGFESYNGSCELLAPKDPILRNPVQHGYFTRILKADEWQPYYQLAKQVTPIMAQKYRPITPERFRPSFLERWTRRILEPVSGITSGGIAIYPQGNSEPCATAQYTARTRPAGYHEINLRVDPEHPGIADDLLEAGLSLLETRHPGHAIHLHLYTWQEPLLAAAQAIGFTVHRTYHTMGMRLE